MSPVVLLILVLIFFLIIILLLILLLFSRPDSSFLALRAHLQKDERVKSVEEQLAIIRHGVEQIETEAELRQKLDRSVNTGKPLRVKYGIDPTAAAVHLGHTVPLRKLRLF